ncbi:acylphosphatase-2 isoform X3 [Macaca fascicularis]|uniref:acylphosphatase-2 isoform X3 n=1 Tax=Macaca fascicularis TaxID=9541 RepID=UPI0032B04BC6
MCPLPLAAAAVAAPRALLRLLNRGLAAAMSTAGPLKSVDYEVFGRVQGVCFRMYTEDEAKKIGVVGWVKNTSKGTVTGQVQGPEDKVNSINTNWKPKRSKMIDAQHFQKDTSLCNNRLHLFYLRERI